MKSKFLSLAWLALLVPVLVVLMSSASDSAASTDGWWDSTWAYRVPVTVSANSFSRNNKPVEVPINFTTLLNSLGKSGSLDPNSIRVIEVDNADNTLNANVPFQFDKGAGYNAATNAEGTVVFLMEGNTGGGQARRFQIYFDLVGSNHMLPSFYDRVQTTSIIDAYGYDTYKIVTPGGTYRYHKAGGGFASLIDINTNDWISWNPAGANKGDFRGIPNMVNPNDGGYFHPGRNIVSTTLAYDGPLRTRLRSVSNDGKWETVWDIFPTYARMTVVRVDPTKYYWFLYEGTPGGVFEPSTDLVTKSDGTQATADVSWTGDIPGEEWVYFTDPALGRSLFVIHHQEDDKVDSYRPSSPDPVMTILGFGRDSTAGRYLTGADRQLSFGLVDKSLFSDVRTVVRDVYKPLDISKGAPESNPNPQSTPSVTVVPPTTTATLAPTNTPTPTGTFTPIPTFTSTPTATAVIPTVTPTYTPTEMPTITATAPAPIEYLIYMGAVFSDVTPD